MQTYSSIRAILDNIKYKPGWVFDIAEIGDDGGHLIRVRFMAPDNDKPNSEPALVSGRKWYISPHSTDGEIVQTAFAAIKMAEEHETRELFTYMGARVFGPHHNIDALVDFTLKTPEVLRDNHKAMKSYAAWVKEYMQARNVSKPIEREPESEPTPISSPVSLNTVAKAIREASPMINTQNAMRIAITELISQSIKDPTIAALFWEACKLD